MKKLLQAVDIEKYIPLFKRGIASLIICSMLMSDAAKAMEEEEPDPSHLPILQRTPSSNPQSNSSELNSSSSDGDSSPRSESLSSTLRITGLEIIDSRPSSDDSGSSPEKSLLEGDKSSPIILFPALSSSGSQNIPSASISFTPAPSSFPSQQVDLQSSLGITPSSLQDRVPSPQVFSGSTEARSSSRDTHSQGGLRPSEADLLLVSGSNSYGSSHSSHSSESSSDAEEDVEIGETDHPQLESLKPFGGLRDAFGQFIKKFTSSQPLTTDQSMMPSSNRWQSTPSVITLKNNEILENGGNDFILGQGHLSIQSQDGGEGELTVDVDLDGDDENQALQSSCCSRHPFGPQLPEYTLTPGALQRASQFLTLLPKQAPESHYSVSDEGERSNSFDSESPQSDSPTRGSPTAILRHEGILPDSSEDDLDIEAHLLPADHPHRTMDYASFKGMLRPSESSSIPHLDQDFDPTAVIILHPGSLSPQDAWLQFLDGLKGETKTHLINFTDKVLNDQTSWPGRLGKWIIGPLIGAGFAYGMGPVYSGGLTYLADQVPAFKDFLDSTAGNIFIWYITAIAVPDGIVRNSHSYGQGFDYLFSSEKKELGRMCIAGTIASLTAFIPVAYLILAENLGRELLGLSGWDNQFGITVAVCGPPLYLDAFGNGFKIAWDAVPKLKAWFRGFKEMCCPSLFPSQMKSEGEIKRENFDHNLLQLKRFLAGASDVLITRIYNGIQGVLNSIDIHKDKKAAGVLAYLLSVGDQVQKVTAKNAKKSLSEISFDFFKYTSLILGAPTIALLLQLVGSTVASLFTSDVAADSIGGGFALIAFLPFNYVLAQFIDNFKNLLSGEDPQGYGSHPAARLPVKVFIGIQSLLYLFQTSIAVLQSYQKWFGDGWWPFAAAIPFFIPKLMELGSNFNGSFNEQITTSVINLSHRIGGRCRGESLCTPCKKGKLLRLIEQSRRNLGSWDSKSIHELSKPIEFFKHNEAGILFEER